MRLPAPDLKFIGSTGVSDTSAACKSLSLLLSKSPVFGLGALWSSNVLLSNCLVVLFILLSNMKSLLVPVA